ncbi:hypothetical protein [Amycolatopsis cihanbeyliensis]|uniref:Excreted virulence factor EspC (Type VII ESX diderm) n=1 Tax=Amycolatopsis cihanbeyliensis TaxID=1128664 RepID=A0A542DEF6_AMYCI|nr:hypothetical protein [Amycolatopsis cihanbeyliensis]TQJ01442.1 hypothetical protein FB471_1122 [Amycolatopsis cihanbeyliensis]
MPDGGYSYEPGALQRIVAELGQGSELLDQAATAGAEAPDAGASSTHVARAMQALMTSAVAAARMLDDIAGKVHVASGAYEQIENNHEGALRRERREAWGDGKSFAEQNIPLN